MMNSFHELVTESNTPRVNEMGVKGLERISGSQIGQARAETVRRSANLANRPARRNYNEVAAELFTAMKSIRRSDITMHVNTSSLYYYPTFPDQIVRLMQELNQIDGSRMNNEFGNWFNVTNSSSAIHFKTDSESSFYRSHFPNGGIPMSLRGIGLGFKLYRTLLKYTKYMMSYPNATGEAQKAWGSLLSYKSNPDGSPSEDDAHAIIGPGQWLAMDKVEMTSAQKIDVAKRFITDKIGLDNTTPNRFDMDDELIEIMPNEFLVKLDDEYINHLLTDGRLSQERTRAIEASRSESERLEMKRRQREENERRERAAREEAAIRTRLASRLAQFGAEPDSDWEVGDFIVVKEYLYRESYPELPIRQVVNVNNGQYTAVKVRDAQQIELGNMPLNSASDTRTTRDKTQWIKVNVNSIPDLTRVNLTPDEIRYVESRLTPEAVERIDRERSEAEEARIEAQRQENARRLEAEAAQRKAQATAQTQAVPTQGSEIFGPIPQTGEALRQFVWETRKPMKAQLLNKFMEDAFTRFFVLNSQQKQMLRGSFGVGVYCGYRQIGRRLKASTIVPLDGPDDLLSGDPNIGLINLATGHIVPGPYAGLGLTAYMLAQVTMEDKISLRPGTHFYIAKNSNNYGVFAKATYQRRGSQDQPIVMLNAYDFRDITTTITQIKKVVQVVEL